ncbi:Iron hydrogenase 1 [bioreactor metagenome]|uniref:Iron hydrogenase 1 n=1 Tax=bioreactor metagenome TaxID=1076179 RepID=A0A645IMB9_9ZZZZ
MARGDKLMTSSCCPAWVEAAKRHIPEILPFVSSTPSPMAFAGRLVAEQYPDAVKVFIGPCIAKRREAQNDPNVDFVMTFEELGALLAAQEIDVISQEAPPLKRPAASYARNFAKSCGVSQAILQEIGAENPDSPRPKIEEKFINGLDRKSVNLLKLYAKGKLPGNFIEVMACPGGCVGGPCSLAH